MTMTLIDLANAPENWLLLEPYLKTVVLVCSRSAPNRLNKLAQFIGTLHLQLVYISHSCKSVGTL
jgi:hypothetical protein